MLHILGLPHTRISEVFSTCAFTQKILNFRKILDILWYKYKIYSPGGEWVVQCMTNEERDRIFKGNTWQTMYDRSNTEGRDIFNVNAINEINSCKRAGDLIIATYGELNDKIIQGTDLPAMELGIWYRGVSQKSKYKVFESYARMNYVYWSFGLSPNDYDCVIPNYYDLKQFCRTDYPNTKEEYILFVGRLNWEKWPQVAVDVAKKLGVKIKVAWQKGTREIDPYCEYVGVVGIWERSMLMAGAKAFFMPTQYVEPFGGVAVEAMLCWTPIITSDNGGQHEINVHWLTGYRCRSFNEYVEAYKNIDKIERKVVHDWACSQYSLEVIAPLYKKQIDKVLDHVQGWSWYSLQ